MLIHATVENAPQLGAEPCRISVSFPVRKYVVPDRLKMDIQNDGVCLEHYTLKSFLGLDIRGIHARLCKVDGNTTRLTKLGQTTLGAPARIKIDLSALRALGEDPTGSKFLSDRSMVFESFPSDT